MLGNVHTLNLSFTNITDVSALDKVHILDISYTEITYTSYISVLNKIGRICLSGDQRRRFALIERDRLYKYLP